MFVTLSCFLLKKTCLAQATQDHMGQWYEYTQWRTRGDQTIRGLTTVFERAERGKHEGRWPLPTGLQSKLHNTTRKKEKGSFKNGADYHLEYNEHIGTNMFSWKRSKIELCLSPIWCQALLSSLLLLLTDPPHPTCSLCSVAFTEYRLHPRMLYVLLLPLQHPWWSGVGRDKYQRLVHSTHICHSSLSHSLSRQTDRQTQACSSRLSGPAEKSNAWLL